MVTAVAHWFTALANWLGALQPWVAPPKSTAPGVTKKQLESRSPCRPTESRGARPSLERTTSVAFEVPPCAGEKETTRSTLAPGSPTDALDGDTDQEASLETIETPLSESGAIRCGSRPTLVMVTLPVRVVPVAVAPTKSDLGRCCTTGPMPRPVTVSTAGPPSEAGMLATEFCAPRPRGAKRAVPVTFSPGAIT